MRQAFMIVACLAVLPGSAAAAGTDPQGAKPTDAKPGIVVERVENGFEVGPDVKFTQVNGHDGVLVGGFGGALVDRTLFIGGAAYWLANGDWDRGLSYGGLLVQWHFFSRKTVNVNVGGLVGAGWGTASYQWSYSGVPPPYPTPRHNGGEVGHYPPGYGGGTMYAAYDAGLFVAEPQVNLVWRAADWMSLSAGVGYRAVAGAGDFNHEFQGMTGSVAIRFGSSSK
jgi:hypothetical protein